MGIWLTYDDDGIYDSSGNIMIDSEDVIYNNYMPTYLSVEKDGEIVVAKTIQSRSISMNGTSERYATITLDEPGTYRLSVASHLGTGNPETITVTVGGGSPAVTPDPTVPTGNPGYYLIPEQTEYTINLADSDRARFNFRLSLYREESNFWWGFTQAGDDILEMIDEYEENSKGGPPLVLTQEDGLHVCDTHIDFRASGVGTATIDIAVYVNSVEYDKHTITFHVIDDPNATPAPTPTAPAPTPTAPVPTPTAPVPTPTAPVPTPTAPVPTPPAPISPPAPVSIADAKITGIKATAAYTGSAIKPEPVVKYNGVKLVKGTDYKVTYKNNKKVGKATVVIKGIGNYTGTVKKTFRILPKKVALTKLTAGKKKLTVKWEKTAGAGYQIQYGLKKNFAGAKSVTIAKSGTVKKVLKNLKSGKVYYVRIRGYKKIGGKVYASKWSKALKKKVG